jgi:hypothetical protein
MAFPHFVYGYEDIASSEQLMPPTRCYLSRSHRAHEELEAIERCRTANAHFKRARQLFRSLYFNIYSVRRQAAFWQLVRRHRVVMVAAVGDTARPFLRGRSVA